MNQKKKLFFSILGIITALLIALGITYAVFTYTKKGNTGNTISTGKLAFLYTENTGTGTGINISDAFPVSDELGKAYSSDDQVFDFKVESEIVGDMSIPYEVTVGKTITSTLDEQYIKLYLTDTTENDEVVLMNPVRYSELPESSTEEDEKQIFFDAVDSGENYLKKFRLRMWIADSDINDEEINQDDINGKSFTVKVNVYSNENVIKQKINVLNVVAIDKDGKDLNASSALITGSEKESLLNKLVSDGYIDKTNRINTLVEIDTDDFDNTATTTIDVSNIASVGDKIVVFHYNESTNKWEYINIVEVTSSGTIVVDFDSFSPVGLAVVKNDDFSGITIKTEGSVVAPIAKSLGYTGSAQELINAGSSSTGTIVYKLDNGSYSTSIPTATNAGTYTVYYKVIGDSNHLDVEEQSISVTIKSGPTYVAPQNGETHKGIVYLDPTDLQVYCDSTNSVSTTNTKEGCMKWYVYDYSGNTYKMILDHNAISIIKWSDSGKNVSYEKSNIPSAIQNELSNWDKTLNTNLITADEINKLTGKTGFNVNDYNTWYYLDSKNQTQVANSTNRSTYAWLYDYTYDCINYGCNIEDNNGYTLYNSTSTDYILGYWTKTPVGTAGSGTLMWLVDFYGPLANWYVDDPGNRAGVRPVITLDYNF